jgi:hypothetical protein
MFRVFAQNLVRYLNACSAPPISLGIFNRVQSRRPTFLVLFIIEMAQELAEQSALLRIQLLRHPDEHERRELLEEAGSSG